MHSRVDAQGLPAFGASRLRRQDDAERPDRRHTATVLRAGQLPIAPGVEETGLRPGYST